MAKKVSLVNMKGGVGKTTLTVNLAHHFARLDPWFRKVLVVDLDPQFNATQYLLRPSEYRSMSDRGQATIYDVFERDLYFQRVEAAVGDSYCPIYPVHENPYGGKIDLLPSTLKLARSLRKPANKEHRLAQFIYDIEAAYDLILIDCAPTESLLTIAAYLASDYLLVPVKPEYLSSIGLPYLALSLNDFHDEYPERNIEVAGVVFNTTQDYYPEEPQAKDDVRRIAQQYGWPVFRTEFPYSRSYSKGAREGEPIFRTSKAHRDKKEQALEFAREFAESIGWWGYFDD